MTPRKDCAPAESASLLGMIGQHYITKVRADLGMTETHQWLLAHCRGDFSDVAVAADMLLMDIADRDEENGVLLDEGMLWILARIGARLIVGTVGREAS